MIFKNGYLQMGFDYPLISINKGSKISLFLSNGNLIFHMIY